MSSERAKMKSNAKKSLDTVLIQLLWSADIAIAVKEKIASSPLTDLNWIVGEPRLDSSLFKNCRNTVQVCM